MKNKSKIIPPLLNIDIGLFDVTECVDACKLKELEEHQYKRENDGKRHQSEKGYKISLPLLWHR